MSFSTDLQWCPLRPEWKQALMNYFSVSMWEAQPHVLPECPECWDGTVRGPTMLPPLHSAGSHQPPTSPAVGQAMGRLRAAIGRIKHQPREYVPLLLLLPLQEQSFVCSNPAMLMAFYAEKNSHSIPLDPPERAVCPPPSFQEYSAFLWTQNKPK